MKLAGMCAISSNVASRDVGFTDKMSGGPVTGPPTSEADAPGPGALTREDLVRRLCLALDIAKRAISVLGEDGYWDAEKPEESFGRDKPLAETAMLLHVASSITAHPEVQERVDDLAHLLAPYARAPRTRCAIALHPTICFQLGMPHILLSQLGLIDRGFDRLIGMSAESQAHHGREVVPHRALEQMWLKALWSGTRPGAEFDAMAKESVLRRPVDLLWGSREDAYAHTHAFMYFTNFGYWRRTLPRNRGDVLAESGGLLTRSLLLEDYDLAAEVLMAWPLTSARWTPDAAFGFRVLADLEDRVGFLPAGNGIPEKFGRLAGSDRTKYAIAATYHTAFVMGMLCSLALRSANALEITGPRASAAFIDELLDVIPVADTPWQQTFRQLPPAESQSLGGFLLNMALLTKIRCHDYAAAERLIQAAVRHRLANAPMVAQAAELLGRVAASAARINENTPVTV